MNFPDIPAGWVTIIAAVIVGAGSFYAAKKTSKSSEPMGVKLITETTLSLVEPLKTELAEVRRRESRGRTTGVARTRGTPRPASHRARRDPRPV